MWQKKLIVGLVALVLLCSALPANAQSQYTGPGSDGDGAKLVWSPWYEWILSWVRSWADRIEGPREPEATPP